MSVRSEPADPVPYEWMSGPATLVFADDAVRRERLAGLAVAMGGRVVAATGLAEAGDRLDRQAGTAIVVLDIARDDGTELDRLLAMLRAGADAARFEGVVIAAEAVVDIVAGAIDGRHVDIAWASDERGIAASVARRLAPRTGGVTEPGSDDAARRLAELGEETSRIAHALAALSARIDGGSDMVAATPVDALAMARTLLRMRRLRERFFDAALFADPAWDILLDLFVAGIEGRPTAVSSLCIAAAVPPTTALRWITTMTERGLLQRRPDPADGRRIFLSLGDATNSAVAGYIAAASRLAVPV